jgi:hypothetical protein
MVAVSGWDVGTGIARIARHVGTAIGTDRRCSTEAIRDESSWRGGES